MQVFRTRLRTSTTTTTNTVSSALTSSFRHQASPATTESTNENNNNNNSKHPFLSYNSDFILSQIDYCSKLAEEANTKHGVPLNVPPQANPPTDIHQVVYCDSLSKRSLDPSSFAYPLIFEPPPKTVPGMETPKVEKMTSSAPTMKKGGESSIDYKKVAGISSKWKDLINPLKALMGQLPVSMSAGESSLLGDLDLELGAGGKPAKIFTMPSDTEIDTLLLDTWDNVVMNKLENEELTKDFKPSASFLVATTDTPTAPATLVRSEDLLASLPTAANLGGAGGKSETSIHFRTPFTTADMLNRQQALQQENNQSQTHLPKPPSLSKHVEKKFICQECNKGFRLIDGVINHYKMVHGKNVPQKVLLQYKALDNPIVARDVETFVKRQEAIAAKLLLQQQQQEKEATSSSTATTISSQENEENNNKNILSSDATPNGALVGEAAIRATPVPESDIHVHARTATNTVLVGNVKEIRSGYVKADFIVQLLVQTQFLKDHDNEKEKQQQRSEEEKQKEKEQEEEIVDLHTIRCFGEEFTKRILEQVKEGSRVMINGNLKMNRHFEPSSGSIQSFPFVKVIAPYGNVLPI